MSDLFGRPIVVIPYSSPGCRARVTGFLMRWAKRLAWFGAGVLAGYVIGLNA